MNTKEQSFLEVGEGLKVLYVEDSDIVRESTFDMLEVYFEHVDVAKDGEEGLQKYKHFHQENGHYYDIVITDINMPKMNGIEMIEAIFALNSKANIIVVSAHNEADYLLKLINMGISNYILKPIEINQFQTVVMRVIQNVMTQKKITLYYSKIQKMNLALREATRNAEKASQQKSRFLANMSHEIRTPLNAITGFISLLGEKETDPEKLKYLEVVRNASDSLLQIISDILDISKIESGKLSIHRTNFNPYEDLITVGELFQVKAAEKGVILKIQYNHSMPKTLFSDVLRIKQILTNLLSNAVKFTPEGSVVKCIIWYAAGRLNIRVKDYGIGIPEDQQQSIFHSFAQVEGTTQVYGGTGLGLTISMQLARMLGGELTLKSSEGRGSTFKLSLPMPLGETKQRASDSAADDAAPLCGHILLVEDYEANRMFVGIILANAGITYETANDGIEAIEKFKSGNYDLILMDENMPNLGGIGATKAILQIEKEQGLKHTPVVSLTANALKGDRERFLEAGMDDYISKPIEPETLMRVMRSFLCRNTPALQEETL